MKPSHLVTPRTMDECTFYPGMDPIEKPTETPYSYAEMVIVIGGLLGIAVLAVLMWRGVL